MAIDGSKVRLPEGQEIQAHFGAISLKNFITSVGELKPVKELGDKIQELFQLRPSQKHLSGINLGRLEPTSSLTYKY